MDSLFAAFEALQNAPLPTALRVSDLAYPLVNAAHIIGFALLFGSIVALDLRLVGLWRELPLKPLARMLTPLAFAGLVTALTAGVLLFSVHAVKYAALPVFQLKLTLIAAALVNALLTRRSAAWKEAASEPGRPIPVRLVLAAALSIVLWIAVILCGRLIAYFS